METNNNPAPYTGKEGEEFDLELSARWTKNHREKHPDQYYAHFFGKEIIQRIIDQPGCVGIRMYHAFDDDDKRHIILVGATKDGHDMVPKHETKTGGRISLSRGEIKEVKTKEITEHYGIVAQVSDPCPGPNCR
jgi:hypothetical protein